MKFMSMKQKDQSAKENAGTGSASAERRMPKGRFQLATLAILALMPGMGGQAAVAVDQSPLIVSDPLPPNIMLLHDDSGSMAWNYLPDNAPRSGDEFRDSSQNRQYYNPETLYPIPPKADGTSYPKPTFPNGYKDPFDGTRTDNILLNSAYSDSSGSYVDSSYKNRNSCEKAGGDWSWRLFGGGLCEFDVARSFIYFDSNGNEHRVIEDSESCGALPNCHQAGKPLVVGGETTTYGQNVANYYSYYRTRYLSAKSGIMSAFSELDPAFRVGFGAINNSSSNNLSDDTFSQDFFSGRSRQTFTLEQVKPFGDGTNSTQKKRFWDWLEDVGYNGGTPLRRALETAGRYYQTQQPWLSTDPQGTEVEYSCRPSYTIMVSDGYWSGNAPSDFLKDSDMTATDNYTVADPFKGGTADDGGATLADVANYYWKTDLRPGATDGQRNQVPATPSDPATWQHMTTFTVGLGLEVSGLGATQSELFEWARTGVQPESVTSWPGWPEPGDGNGQGEPENVSDMLHAAINGHGNFFSARDPQQFAEGIRKALAEIASTPGAGGSPTFSGGETLTSATRQYSAGYTTGSWVGELRSVGYDEETDTFSVSPWRASDQFPVPASRNIWTTTPEGTAVEFKADNLSGYLTTLEDNLYPSDTKGAGWGAHIVNYLRGDQTYENTAETPLVTDVFRKRDSLLGDIVSSTPVAIGDPNGDLYKNVLVKTYFDGLTGDSDYKKFVTDNTGRTPIVYVAANDGMLHAFNANTGAEVFAYIPGSVVGASGDASIARLANPEYGVYSPVDGTQPVPHQYYNDGKLTTQNVYLDGEWKTVLVGTTGRGPSKTVYALDITDPSILADPDKAASAILWERSAGDGESNAEWIGMALGRPTISLVKGSGTEKGQWVAHIGNGPNSGEDKAALLQFDLATGELKVYQAGEMTENGLAAPYVIQRDDTDGVSEYAFAGDLQGNVWRFSLTTDDDTAVSELIYIAKDAAGNRQPITADMYATKNEKTGAIWVFFGTGRFLTDADIREVNPKVQTWYGLRGLAGTSGLDEAVSTHSRSNLQKREIIAEESVGGDIYRVTSLGSFSELLSGGKVGWYMDLVSPEEGREGERAIYQTQLIAGRLMINTLIPKSSSPCDTFPGGATLIVDPFSGANPGAAVLDANGDGFTNNDDSIEIDGVTYFFNARRYDVGMAGAFSALRVEDGTVRLFGLGIDSSQMTLETTMGATGAQRLNWHEIIN